jgi:CRP-like cAMP-binding protein
LAKAKKDKGVTQCAAGTVLFREGEDGAKMYVIKSGRVRLTKRVFDQDVVIEELRGGDFCGEISLVTEQQRPVTATVVQDAAVIQIESAQFENMIRGNSDIAVRMMKKMSRRLTQAQFRISNFTLRTTRARLMHQLRWESHRASEEFDAVAPIPDDLADVLQLEIGEVKRLLGELVRDDMIQIDKRGNFHIIDITAFDRQLKYLELKDHFEYRD